MTSDMSNKYTQLSLARSNLISRDVHTGHETGDEGTQGTRGPGQIIFVRHMKTRSIQGK